MAKIGVIHYNWPNFSFAKFLEFAADSGCTHVELERRDVFPEDDVDAPLRGLLESAARVRREVEAHSLKISALNACNDFVQSDRAARTKQVAQMRRVCEITRELGPDAIVRSEGGKPKDDLHRDAQWDSMRECFTHCMPFLEELEISLAIDNHGVVTNDGDRLLLLLQELDHPRLGSNLDTMNFRWFGHSIEECNRIYAQLAPRVLHAHFKDGNGTRGEYRGAALGEGEIDLRYAAQRLKKCGYDGVYTAEYEGTELDGTGYRKCVEWLRQNI